MRISFFKKLDRAIDGADPELSLALSEVRKWLYVSIGSGMRRRKEYFATLTLPQEEAAHELGITTSSLRDARSRMSAEAYSYFGDDFFTLTRPADVRKRYEEVTNDRSLVSLMVPGTVRSLTTAGGEWSGTKYDPRECSDELTFLRDYSNSGFAKALSRLDPDKLAFLVQSVDSRVDRTVRANLINLLK